MAYYSSPEKMPRALRNFVGGFATLMGLYILAAGAGAMMVPEGSRDAPPWVFMTIGGTFTLMGAWMLTAGTPVGNALERVGRPLTVVGLLAVGNWVAFWADMRGCSGGLSIPFVSVAGPAGPNQCRIAFVYGAILFDSVLLGLLLSTWADRRPEGRGTRTLKRIASVLIWVPLTPIIVLGVVLATAKGLSAKLGRRAPAESWPGDEP